MLKHLTQLIEQTEGELTLNQLSRELGASPSAVAGMLEILIHKGGWNVGNPNTQRPDNRARCRLWSL